MRVKVSVMKVKILVSYLRGKMLKSYIDYRLISLVCMIKDEVLTHRCKSLVTLMTTINNFRERVFFIDLLHVLNYMKLVIVLIICVKFCKNIFITIKI